MSREAKLLAILADIDNEIEYRKNRMQLQKVLDDFEKLGLLVRNGNGDYEPDLKRLEEVGLIEWLPDGTYRRKEA